MAEAIPDGFALAVLIPALVQVGAAGRGRADGDQLVGRIAVVLDDEGTMGRACLNGKPLQAVQKRE